MRSDLLAKLGRFDEARHEFVRAASLKRNQRKRTLLLGGPPPVRTDRRRRPRADESGRPRRYTCRQAIKHRLELRCDFGPDMPDLNCQLC